MRPLSAVDETRLEEASRRLAGASPNMLFVIVDGKVVYANRKAEEALGICREEGSARCLEVFRMVAVAPEYLHVGRQGRRRRSRGEEVPPSDYALLTRDGRRIEGVLTSALIEDRGRRKLLGIFTDKP
jgi:PAS domain S-box-containing protein